MRYGALANRGLGGSRDLVCAYDWAWNPAFNLAKWPDMAYPNRNYSYKPGYRYLLSPTSLQGCKAHPACRLSHVQVGSLEVGSFHTAPITATISTLDS